MSTTEEVKDLDNVDMDKLLYGDLDLRVNFNETSNGGKGKMGVNQKAKQVPDLVTSHLSTVGISPYLQQIQQ